MRDDHDFGRRWEDAGARVRENRRSLARDFERQRRIATAIAILISTAFVAGLIWLATHA